MLPDIQRTIVALATAPRPAERAIVRLAGPSTRAILRKLCEKPTRRILGPRLPPVVQLPMFAPNCAGDVARNLLYWPNDRSYTGSPAAEIHLLGCVPLAEAVINSCCELGAEPAQRGEFTLRAFLAGKLDLAQAEAVLGVIEADSQHSLKTALSQLGGNFGTSHRALRAMLIDVVAELEAGLDFVDEDIQFISAEQIVVQLQTVGRQLEEFAARLDTRSSTDRAPQVVLAGLPNSGKSSLFNAICRQPLAIVADIPGTTRDYLQHRIQLHSHQGRIDLVAQSHPRTRSHHTKSEFDLIDTAGWEEMSGATPRAMAQAQLAKCLKQAQLGLLCIDMSMPCAQVEIWKQFQNSTPICGG